MAEAMGWCRAHLAGLLKSLDPDKRHVTGEDLARSGGVTVVLPRHLPPSPPWSFTTRHRALWSLQALYSSQALRRSHTALAGAI